MGKMNTRADNGLRVQFQYAEVVHNHYTYRDAVDNNNKCRMYPIAIEESAKTTRWPTRVFNFILGVSEVNTRLAASKIYHYNDLSQIEFWRKLSQELINNPYLPKDPEVRRISPRKRPFTSTHSHVPIPPFRTFRGAQLVKCKGKYNQLKCHGCPGRVRTYCACSPGTILCKSCWLIHCQSTA